MYHKSNDNWIADTFELNVYECLGADLTIDKYNRIWCIYTAFNPSDTIWYQIVAHKDSLGWEKDTVEYAKGARFSWVSIATDTFGCPHITYIDTVNLFWTWFGGFYAYLDDTTWQKAVVDSYIVDYCCSIDLDSNNVPYISYFRFDTLTVGENLWCAKKTGGAWFREEVDHTDYASWWTTSIRINPVTGLPAIAYRDPNTYQMKYAWHDGTTWHVDTLAVQGGIGTQKALDIDSLGRPWLLYAAVNYPSNVVAYKDSDGVWHKYPLPPLTPPFTRSGPGALRIGRDGTIHVTKLVTNDNYTIREVHYIYGTPEGIEENDQILKPDSTISEITITPNPANGRFEIRFNSSGKHKVAVKIYDVMGRLVENVFDGKAKSGINEFLIMPENLSAGVYFVWFEAGDYNKVEKIILLR